MVARACLIAIFVGICLSLCNSQISESIQSREIQSFKNTALDTLSHPLALGATFYATEILKTTKSTGHTCNCGTISSLLKQATSNLDVYYGLSSSAACGCSTDVSSEARSAAVNGLKVMSISDYRNTMSISWKSKNRNHLSSHTQF